MVRLVFEFYKVFVLSIGRIPIFFYRGVLGGRFFLLKPVELILNHFSFVFEFVKGYGFLEKLFLLIFLGSEFFEVLLGVDVFDSLDLVEIFEFFGGLL